MCVCLQWRHHLFSAATCASQCKLRRLSENARLSALLYVLRRCSLSESNDAMACSMPEYKFITPTSKVLGRILKVGVQKFKQGGTTCAYLYYVFGYFMHSKKFTNRP